MINKLKHTKNKKGQEQLGIDINVLYQYFRDLNRCPEISDEINLATLNKHITQDELIKKITKQVGKTRFEMNILKQHNS